MGSLEQNTVPGLPNAALSVADVTAYIQSLLGADPQLQRLWVVGEVCSASERHGHIFFTLQDPDASAAIQAVVWRSQRHKLASHPAPGAQVVLLGKLRIYPQRGQYQINVVQILPLGEGLQALRHRQLRQRLIAEGLFDQACKRPLPPYPTRIAVVTSAAGAAWGDIQQTLKKRQPGLRVLLSPALVQGPEAPCSIAAALQRVARDSRAELVILARGGGAREDLSCFDDERVVRAIAAFPLPVITGIGHERDETLADLVADCKAHTPTAAAEQAVPPIANLWAAHYRDVGRVRQSFQVALQGHYRRVAEVRRRLEELPLGRQLQQDAERLTWLWERLQQTMQHRLQSAHQECYRWQQSLRALKPEAVLQRGYALVTTTQGRIVNTIADLKIGDIVDIQTGHGKLSAQILSTSPHDHSDRP